MLYFDYINRIKAGQMYSRFFVHNFNNKSVSHESLILVQWPDQNTLQCFPTSISGHFWFDYNLVTESTGRRLHTRLAFSKSKKADKMATKMLEMA